jgi:hypothetical protein
MKAPFLTLRSRSVSTIVISLTLIALCFSVGEGLRLTPFPVNAQLNPASVPTTSGSSHLNVQHYGPLAVPTQLQKRDKRFAIELSSPVSAHDYELFRYLYASPEPHSFIVASALRIAFPSDRAPPLTAWHRSKTRSF